MLYQSLKQRTDVKFADGEHLGSSYIKAVIPFVFFGKYKGYRVIGTDESFLERPDPQDTPILSQGKWASGTGEVVLGSEVARHEGLATGDTLVVTAWTGDSAQKEETLSLTLKVSGIFARSGTAWDRALFSNLEEARKVLAASNLGPRTIWKGEVLNYFLLYLPAGKLSIAGGFDQQAHHRAGHPRGRRNTPARRVGRRGGSSAFSCPF